MNAPGTSRRRPLGLLTESSRVEAFSDGVLAIAVTLLVLDLRAPEARGAFAHDLAHQVPTYLAYLAAFVTISVIWVNHHVVFTRVAHVDPTLIWANLALLGATSVLPFPTSVLARALEVGSRGDQVAAVGLYAAVSALQSLCWWMLYRHLRRTPGLLDSSTSPGLFAGEKSRAVFGGVLVILAGVSALAAPVPAAIVVLLLPLFYGITSHVLAVRAARTDAPGQGDRFGSAQ